MPVGRESTKVRLVWKGLLAFTRCAPSLITNIMYLKCCQELPRRKQQVTQEKSKVLRETEENPFGDGEDEEEETPKHSRSQSSSKPQSSSNPSVSSKLTATGLSHAYTKPADTKKSKKDKKGSKKKAKPFNLEEEKDKMKGVIAESSVASVNLLNALKLINREHEQVSDNTGAVAHFETCKTLRRQILRYVSISIN
jgi:hypothetical protein